MTDVHRHPVETARRRFQAVIRAIGRWVGNLTVQDWAWLHFKAAVLAWVLTLWRFVPVKVGDALGGVIVAVAVVTIVGAVTSILGLVIAAQSRRVAVAGLGVELAGLWVMAAGPVSYLAVQVYLASTLPDGDQRYALCFFAYTLCAAVGARIVIVIRRRRRTILGV